MAAVSSTAPACPSTCASTADAGGKVMAGEKGKKESLIFPFSDRTLARLRFQPYHHLRALLTGDGVTLSLTCYANEAHDTVTNQNLGT